MLLQKTLYETESGFRVILKDFAHKKSYNAEGNIPRLPNGINLTVKIVDGVILDYEIALTDRNKKVLENKGYDIEDFTEKMRLHKETRLPWKYIENGTHPYEAYPFQIADKVAKKLGWKKKDKERMDALTREVVETFRKKRQDTYEMESFLDVFREVEEKGAFSKLELPEVVDTITSTKFSLRNGKICDYELVRANYFIKSNVSNRNRMRNFLLKEEDISSYLNNANTSLSEEQKNCVKLLIDTRVSVITGGAGVGKTTVISEILNCYESIEGKGKALLLAPTGKASRRIAEKTNREAFTIHSALRKNEDFIFYNENNPLEQSLYIIDESSMIDTLLMRDLLKAIPMDAKIIFVGDCNQLYPVGCGEPFFDMVASCYTIYLTKNFRQKEGKIIDNSIHILKGEPLENATDFCIKRIKKDDILNYVNKDVQNISPFNELNDTINDYIVSHTFKDVSQFHLNENVILLKNRRDANYSNGDIGVVENLNKDGSIDVCVDGKTVTVSKNRLNEIAPSYAITVHKMQGSECDEINVFIPQKETDFITKRMLYTAVTRARKKVNLYLYSSSDFSIA